MDNTIATEAEKDRRGEQDRLTEATRAYYEELHNAWLELQQRCRDAQAECMKTISEANSRATHAAAHERFGKAQRACVIVEQTAAMGGPPDAWDQVKRAQDEYREAAKAVSDLRDGTQRRVNDAHREYTESVKRASADVQKRYESAFRAYLSAQQSAWMELDINTLDPSTVAELGRNLMAIGANAHHNLGKAQMPGFPGS